ncbi:MAG: maltose alpha-D-glucosyltransferase [Chloroflexi bacterium UTCFX4]|nr:MAG: maltose alpha-D-glucosyltransferase [Chloroflexi bacterium UTCFX4]
MALDGALPSAIRALLSVMNDWFKSAVFYQIFVRAYCDSNGDGIGDLRGVMSKLDYIHALGVDTIWLMPITPSPLRDHGYDVSGHFDVHPDYGTLKDFRDLVDAAHARSLRVIVELVPNHTSDQHPWFQASRDPNHPEHEKYRDWYVWSDTDQKYKEARIIFIDYETSNWKFDELRGQYYWHRFFYHQPDLNFDNPQVQKEMLKVAQFWVDQGADGIRVDAPPYLIEREGTSCENLPESHAYYKRLRAFLDAYAPGTMLLAEANQWAKDTLPYFGDGDEFQMNFHFPLMPRIFLALAKGKREPLDWVLAQTPPLPEHCQWATFLRNHDELTLEMVTTAEREFMWNFYAPDIEMRKNLGIRRRLAPLLENDRARIKVAHSLLLTLIGSPVLYYGDEIGMGDNIKLDDRWGVRTPMQWDASPNAGFSNAPSEKLYLPVIDDAKYGYQRVNVQQAADAPDSLLNWLRGALKIRARHPAFGHGELQTLITNNPALFAYTRKTSDEKLLVVNNLSAHAQNIALHLNSRGVARDLENDAKISYDTELIFELPRYGYRWFEIIA